MKTSKILIIVLIAAVLGGGVSAFVVNKLNKDQNTIQIIKTTDESIPRYATFMENGNPQDFSVAAEKTVPAVVHVKVNVEVQPQQSQQQDIFEFFFGPGPNSSRRSTPQIRQGSGSGVIISADGYIVTNNHVVDGAKDITVTLDNKTTLNAKVVGTDKNTDVALLKVEKIENKDFPFLTFSDSDKLRLGQWVLAVGNPFNVSSLTSTVTAGIVSAKSRDLNISNNSLRIESFIQTDAVVNPGNSGGALVNLRGELVGINTAIASRSGQYEGYAFAIPTNIAKKVVEDLIKYGVVQRAMLGITYLDLNGDGITAELAEKEGIKNFSELKKSKGVYISGVVENSAAEKAGIKSGDLLTEIAGKTITSSSIIAEEVGKLRPGDNVTLKIIREGKPREVVANLKNIEGTTEKLAARDDVSTFLGADFNDVVDKELLSKLNIKSGAQVKNIVKSGKLGLQGVEDGFIITTINKKSISSASELKATIKQISKGGVFIEGIYPSGREEYYAFGIK